MSRILAFLNADLSRDARRRDQLLRVARYHQRAARDFAEIGDRASAIANLRLADQAMAVRERQA
jgi:hypothetical protein